MGPLGLIDRDVFHRVGPEKATENCTILSFQTMQSIHKDTYVYMRTCNWKRNSIQYKFVRLRKFNIQSVLRTRATEQSTL